MVARRRDDARGVTEIAVRMPSARVEVRCGLGAGFLQGVWEGQMGLS